ncbi:MAG: glutathionylspermidine synthase family protein [Luteolibacter sp.]
MIRLETNDRRPDWERAVEEAGLLWHGADGAPYWSEDQHLALSLEAAETMEDAANELHGMCLEACEQIIRNRWWDRLAIDPEVARVVEASWNERDLPLYGRFDLAWNGEGSPKLLEYNADTPTSLLEAAVIQWQWKESLFPQDDQLNSIHEALVERWAEFPESLIHFACVWGMPEDRQTLAYLAETAEQAGKTVELLDMGEIGFSVERQCFTDLEEREIERIFKLYPWEWMANEPFFKQVAAHRSRFLEPAWKMMLSNKGLLSILWHLFPDHPLLLPASTAPEPLIAQGISKYVEKPVFGREGAGISIHEGGLVLAKGAAGHEKEPCVYQQHAKLFQAGGNHFVWGLWMIGDECRGLSARGDRSAITGNLSRFFPHRIV